MYPDSYTALYLRLNLNPYLNPYLNLNLNLNLVLYPALNRAPFQKSFQKPFEKPNPSSFRSLFGFRNRSLSVRVGIAPRPKTLLPGRPLYADYLTCARLQPVDNTDVMSQDRFPLFPQFFSPSRLRHSSFGLRTFLICAIWS